MRGFPWQPVLQLDGHVLSLDIWFETEEECAAWIRAEVIGRGLLKEAGVSGTGSRGVITVSCCRCGVTHSWPTGAKPPVDGRGV